MVGLTETIHKPADSQETDIKNSLIPQKEPLTLTLAKMESGVHSDKSVQQALWEENTDFQRSFGNNDLFSRKIVQMLLIQKSFGQHFQMSFGITWANELD